MPVTYDQVPEQPTLLLCQRPFIPYGDLTLVYGEADLGKGRSVASFIADVTRGRPLGLDADGDDPGDVVVLMGEDKPGEHVVGRLIAADADLRRVHDLTKLDGGVRFKFSADPKKPGHLPVLRSYIDQLRRSCLCGQTFKDLDELLAHLAAPGVHLPDHAARNPRLVVGDPMTSLVRGGSIQTNTGARAFMEPIQDMADATGVAVVLVAHPTKDGKLQGSGALRDAARVVLYMHWDEVNKEHRVVEVEKGNNVPPELKQPCKFTIRKRSDSRPYAAWLGKPKASVAANDDWRALKTAERNARAAMLAKVTVANATLPAQSSPAGKPWRVIRWDVPAGGGNGVPGIVGDASGEEGARTLAETTAGCELRWSGYGNPGEPTGLTSHHVRHADGSLTVFTVYDRSAAVANPAA